MSILPHYNFILQVVPVSLSMVNRTNVAFVLLFRKHTKKGKHEAKQLAK